MNTDQRTDTALRAAVDRQRAVAQALFEVQFAQCGGRKPADPTWDDLTDAQQDEWWDRAADAIPVIDRATAALREQLATAQALADYAQQAVNRIAALAQEAGRKLAVKDQEIAERDAALAELGGGW